MSEADKKLDKCADEDLIILIRNQTKGEGVDWLKLLSYDKSDFY